MNVAILEYVGWERGILLENLESLRTGIRNAYETLEASRRRPLKLLTISLPHAIPSETAQTLLRFQPDVTIHAFGAGLAFPNGANESLMGSCEFILEQNSRGEISLCDLGWIAPRARISLSGSNTSGDLEVEDAGSLIAACETGASLVQLASRLKREPARLGCIMIDDIPMGNFAALRVAKRLLKLSLPFVVNVIPALASSTALRPWLALQAAHEGYVCFGQHGYRHFDHSSGTDKYEFGPSRGYAQQLEDIARGKRLLEGMIGRGVAVFCPPYGEYDHNTLLALRETGFTKLVGSSRRIEWNRSPTQWCWGCNPISSVMPGAWSRRLLLARLVRAASDDRLGVGITLHPKQMSGRCISWCLRVIQTLRNRDAVEWKDPE